MTDECSEPEFVDSAGASRMPHVSRATIWRYVNSGRLRPDGHFGRSPVFRPAAIRAYVESMSSGGRIALSGPGREGRKGHGLGQFPDGPREREQRRVAPSAGQYSPPHTPSAAGSEAACAQHGARTGHSRHSASARATCGALCTHDECCPAGRTNQYSSLAPSPLQAARECQEMSPDHVSAGENHAWPIFIRKLPRNPWLQPWGG